MMTLLAFIGVSIIVIIAPGPDTATTIRGTLLGGRKAGVYTAAGIAIGQLIWALATSMGLTAALTASAPLFLAIKYAGAAYLVFLGIQALREAFRPATPELATGDAKQHPLRPWRAFRQGLISDLGNPKMAVFFTSLLPQFVVPGEPAFPALLALGVLFSVMTFGWLTFYALAIDRAGEFLRRPAIRRTVEGVTGAVLMGLGLRIATEHR
jgi:RhtB (resistance to homoserine/threonine) family protein